MPPLVSARASGSNGAAWFERSDRGEPGVIRQIPPLIAPAHGIARADIFPLAVDDRLARSIGDALYSECQVAQELLLPPLGYLAMLISRPKLPA